MEEKEELLQNIIDNPKDLTPYDILSKYEGEADVDIINRKTRNINAPSILDTSGVFSNLPQSNDYLSKEDSVEGFLDLHELQGQSQSGLKQFGLMFPRIGTKILSEIAKLPGTLYGVGEAVFTDSSFAEALDNSWIKAIENLTEEINEEYLPIYATKAVREGNLWDNISSTEFWAKEGADGIGFMASMLVPGLALNKLGAGSKIIKGLTKAGSRVYGGHEKALEAFAKIGLNAKNIDILNATLANTMFEAGSEAGSAMDGFEQTITDKLNRGEIDQEEFTRLLANKGKIGRDIFTSNMGILLLPNLITNKILLGGSKSRLLRSDLYKTGTTQLVESIAARGVRENVKRYLTEFSKGFAREGFLEEGLQSAVENFTTDSVLSGNEDGIFQSQLNFLGNLPKAYWDTISSTEGQKAIFLGGIIGGPMNMVNLYNIDKKDHERKTNILNAINNSLESFSASLTDIWKRDAKGELVFDENGMRVKDPVKIKKIGAALQQIENINEALNEAEAIGDDLTAKAIRQQIAAALSIPFIAQGKEGIEILKEQLNQLQSLKDNVDQNNKDFGTKTTRSEVVNEIVTIAEQMRKDYELFDEYGKDMLKLNNKDASNEDKNTFYNTIRNSYVLSRNRKRFLRNYKRTIEMSMSEAVDDLVGETTFETLEIKKNYLRENLLPYSIMERRVQELNKVLKDIEKEEKSLWNNEEANKEFNKIINDKKTTEKKIQNEEKSADKAVKDVKNSTTEKEVDDAVENAKDISKETKEYVKEEAKKKKDDIAEKEEVNAEIQEKKIQQEEKDNNIVREFEENFDVKINGERFIAQQVDDDGYLIIGVDNWDHSLSGQIVSKKELEKLVGKPLRMPVSDAKDTIGSTEGGEIIKQHESINNLQSNNYFNNEGNDISNSLALKSEEQLQSEEITREHVKVIGVTPKGQKLPFLKDDFIAYLQNGENKVGNEVGFDLGDAIDVKSQEAIDTFNSLGKVTSVEQLMKDHQENLQPILNMFFYLPIKVIVGSNFTSFLTAKPKDSVSQLSKDIFDENELPLRVDIIISALSDNKDFSKTKSTIEFQYPGIIKKSPKINNTIPENNILDLYHFNSYDEVELFFSKNENGNLFDENKKDVDNYFIKAPSRKGYIYTSVPMANGKRFPMKLNVSKVDLQTANLLFNLYYEILNNNIQDSINMTLDGLQESTQENIKENFKTEISLFDIPYKDIKVSEFINLFVFDNTRSNAYRFRIDNGSLVYGSNRANKNAMLNFKDSIVNWLQTQKRRHINIDALSGNSNLNKDKYKNYLIERNILNTDTIIKEPIFQGNTNIFISKNIYKSTLNSNKKEVTLPNEDLIDDLPIGLPDNLKYVIEEKDNSVESGFDFMKNIKDEDIDTPDDFDFFNTKC